MLIRRIRTDGFVDPCIPTRATAAPAGFGWVHEIKHDGYRLIVRRDGPAVRLFTRRGHDWTDRYLAIAAAAAKLRARWWSAAPMGSPCSMPSTGAAVSPIAILQAVDLLELKGVDYQPLPLSRRKDRLARLLARVQVGIAINEHTDD